MEEKQISEQESLRLIQQMIQTAKQEQKDDGKSWIVWGWMLFCASFFSFLNIVFHWGLNQFIFWNAFGILTIVLFVAEFFRKAFGSKRGPVKTYTKELFEKLNLGFFLTLMLIILSMNVWLGGLQVPPQKGFAMLLGLYGFWILIYGSVLNFKPSIVGAYLTWLFAFASLFVTQFEITMLIHAVAVLCGYIIPGHIANREFNKTKVSR